MNNARQKNRVLVGAKQTSVPCSSLCRWLHARHRGAFEGRPTLTLWPAFPPGSPKS